MSHDGLSKDEWLVYGVEFRDTLRRCKDEVHTALKKLQPGLTAKEMDEYIKWANDYKLKSMIEDRMFVLHKQPETINPAAVFYGSEEGTRALYEEAKKRLQDARK